MKFKENLKRLIPSKRKFMQLYFALLLNANFKGFVSGKIYTGDTKNMCIPGIGCYSCPGAVGACPLGALQGAISSKNHSTLYYVGGILMLYSIMLGRLICGWLCPFGFIQEMTYKVKSPKIKKNKVTRALSWLKYVILVFFVFIVPIMYALRDVPLPAFCKYICPAGTLEGGISLLSNKINDGYFSMLGPLFTWKFLILVSILVSSVFIFRIFCRFFCPLGAIYGLFNKISFFGIKVDDSKCTHCGICMKECRFDIKKVGDHECISCGMCVSKCPTKAIEWKGPKPVKKLWQTIQGKEKARNITRAVTCILMLLILVGTVTYFWVSTPSVAQQQNVTVDSSIIDTSEPQAVDVPRGNTVGTLCYGADLPIVTPDAISEETIDPTSSGKITIINFWGTWCTPCVKELPYFERIARDYGDKVAVYAIHSDMLKDTAPEYVGKYYPDSPLIFAADLEGAAYYSTLGGRGPYPYTLVLDERGVITHVFLTSLDYDDLKEAIEEISATNK